MPQKIDYHTLRIVLNISLCEKDFIWGVKLMDLKICNRQGDAWRSRSEEIAAAILYHRSHKGNRVSFNGEDVTGAHYDSRNDEAVIVLNAGREIFANKEFDFSPVVFHPPCDLH